MRRLVAALVVCLGLAAPSCASAVVVEKGGDVDQELAGLKTADAVQLKDADCRPQGASWTIVGSFTLASPLWTCYVSDGLERVYNVTAHVRNATASGDIGSLDRVTVLNCWNDYSNFPCMHRPGIVATAAAAASSPRIEEETGTLIQRQLLALRLTDGARIKQADCRPITSHWSVGSGLQIFGDLWTCYLSDGLARVYNVNAHVRNSKAGGLDKVTVLNCWDKFAHFTCPPGRMIVLPTKHKRSG